MTRAVIIAAGEQSRWDNYLDTPKHLVTLNGEVLIERTIRLLRENDISDILVASIDYVTSATDIYPTLDYENNADADKFLSSKDWWADDDRTLIVYGDVYFTDQAMQTIVHYSSTDWRLFCRPTPNEITGTPFGECFAISLYPDHHEETLTQLHRIAKPHRTGVISRCGGWELATAMMGKPDNQILNKYPKPSSLYVVIDDETDDIDFPDDYERLKKVLEQ